MNNGYIENNNFDDFIVVTRKKNKNCIINKLSNNLKEDLTISMIKNKYINLIKKYKATSAILHGSRARKNNKLDSDIDIVIFWKTIFLPSDELMEEIYIEFKNCFNVDVDMVIMHYKPNCTKDVEHSYSNKFFMENVIIDGIVIYGEESCSYYINSSEKIRKIHF